MTLKERYSRFRTWQKEPYHYSDKGMTGSHCANCNHDFTGNYCPICGQKAETGRISWQSVRKSIMLLWGMDSHSMPYTVFQLLLRPGYFIGDYINGHRQVSYPPVKMLFVIAIIYVIVKQLLGTPVEPTEEKENLRLLFAVIFWMKANPGWGMITVTIIFTIPTWFFFRFAPRHSRHTLPEGVFVQLFMSTLMLICSLMEQFHSFFVLLIPFYYYLTYRQLFGYRFWGTLWRLLLGLIVWILVILFIAVIIAYLSPSINLNEESGGASSLFTIILILIIPLVTLIVSGYWISKKTEKRRLKSVDNQKQSDIDSPNMVK